MFKVLKNKFIISKVFFESFKTREDIIIRETKKEMILSLAERITELDDFITTKIDENGDITIDMEVFISSRKELEEGIKQAVLKGRWTII